MRLLQRFLCHHFLLVLPLPAVAVDLLREQDIDLAQVSIPVFRSPELEYTGSPG